MRNVDYVSVQINGDHNSSLTNSIKCECQLEILKCVIAYISTKLFIHSASSAG